jgi:hypothetical protein
MRHSRLLLSVCVAAALVGCATSPDKVAAVGQDGFHVSVTGARWESQADTNFKAMMLANNYCDKMGKQLLFRQSQESGDHAWSSKREDLTFVCMDSNDPAYMRAGLKRERDNNVLAQQ